MHDISSDLSNARFRSESYCEDLGDNRLGSLLLERNSCLIWKAQEPARPVSVVTSNEPKFASLDGFSGNVHTPRTEPLSRKH
jgi:hypothetical protein